MNEASGEKVGCAGWREKKNKDTHMREREKERGREGEKENVGLGLVSSVICEHATLNLM